ncbi:MAG: biotin/lipoyl-containing protein [Thermaurantimonas sp.]
MQIKYGERVFDIKPGKNNRHKGEINGENYEINLHEIREGEYIVHHKGKKYKILKPFSIPESGHAKLIVNGKPVELEITSEQELLLKKMGIGSSVPSKMADLKAPMPGLVTRVLVSEGDMVSKGTPLLALEAMKMENVIKAHADVRISSILIKKGDAVEKNQILIRFGSV